MPPTPSSIREGYGPVARGLLVLLGVGFVLLAAGIVWLLSWAIIPSSGWYDHALNLALALAVMVILGGYGLTLVKRGVRNDRASRALLLKLNAKWATPIGMGFLLWPCCGLFILAVTRCRPPSGISDHALRSFWYLAEAGLLFPVGIAVHELGHWLAAIAVGLPVRTLRIGPLVIERSDGRHRARLDWTSISALLGFNALDLPEQMPSRPRLLAFVLGGPAANALAAAGCHALQASTHPGSHLHAWLGLAWVVNGYLAIGNLLPFRRRDVMTDGMQALKLLRRPSSGADLLQQIMRKIPAGRPREWGVTTKQLLDALEGAPAIRSKLLLFAYAIAQDGGDEDAQALLDRALREPTLDDEDRHDLELQAALCAALVRGSQAEARTCFDAIDRSGRWSTAYPRLAEAAVLLVEDRRAEARAALAEWEQHVRMSGPRAPFFLGGNQWALERLTRELEETGRTAVGPE